MKPRPFPEACPHGGIEEAWDNVFVVKGSVAIAGPVTLRCSRNMTIIKNGDDLTLINTVRLDERGLQTLEALGTPRHLIRLAGFHGMDDPFYKDRYGATVLSVENDYVAGLKTEYTEDDVYFAPDQVLAGGETLPFPGGELLLIKSAKPREAIIRLEGHGGILITGDSLQNWARADEFFNLPAKIMMRLMGFLKPHNIGPGWLKYASPDPAELKDLLSCEYEHVIPSHGDIVKGEAKAKYAGRLEALS